MAAIAGLDISDLRALIKENIEIALAIEKACTDGSADPKAFSGQIKLALAHDGKHYGSMAYIVRPKEEPQHYLNGKPSPTIIGAFARLLDVSAEIIKQLEEGLVDEALVSSSDASGGNNAGIHAALARIQATLDEMNRNYYGDQQFGSGDGDGNEGGGGGDGDDNGGGEGGDDEEDREADDEADDEGGN